jgi:hypothetical protein
MGPILFTLDRMARPQSSRPSSSPHSEASPPRVESDSHELLTGSSSLWNSLVFLAVLTTLFLLCCFPLVDTDIWWHLKTGQLMWKEWRIPRFDWYTYKDADRPWIDLHWGFQLLLAGLHRLGGIDLIVLFKAAAYTLTAAIAWRTAGNRLPVWLKGLLWITPLVLLAGRALERPEMLSMIFLATTLWILQKAPERPNLLWWLIPLQLVWTNCHALFVLGLIVIWCFVVDNVVREILFPRGNSPADETVPVGTVPVPLLKVLAAAVLATLICFLNPYLHEGFFFPIVLFRKFSSERKIYLSIGEFQSPWMFLRRAGLTNTTPIAFLTLFGLSCLSFVAPLLRQRFSLFRFLLLTAFGWLAWTAVRNQSAFAVVAIVVTCSNLEDGPWSWLNEEFGAAAILRWRLWLSRGVFALYCIWMYAVVSEAWGHSKWNDPRNFGLGERNAWHGHLAAKFAGQGGLPRYAFGAHIGLAATYIYENGPTHKVFMDPRLEVCSIETFLQFNTVLDEMRNGNPKWMDRIRSPDGALPVLILDSRGSRSEINGIMLSLADKWRMVYADASAAVFVESAVADRLNMPMADPTPMMLPPEF